MKTLLKSLFCLCLLFCLQISSAYAKRPPMIGKAETWVAETDENGSQNTKDTMKLVLTFFEVKLDEDDVAHNRYPDVPKGTSFLTGFQIVDISSYSKVAPDCPSPRKQVFQVSGYKDAQGDIVLSMVKSSATLGGTLNIFNSANTFEIRKIKKNTGELTVNFLPYAPSQASFSAKRTGPLKIKRID